MIGPESFGAVITVAAIFLVVLALLWFILPFAVFGIKTRLDQNARLMRIIADRLASIDASLKRQAPDAADAEDGARREPELRARR